MNTDFQGHRYRAVARHREDEEQLLQVGPVRVTSRGHQVLYGSTRCDGIWRAGPVGFMMVRGLLKQSQERRPRGAVNHRHARLGKGTMFRGRRR